MDLSTRRSKGAGRHGPGRPSQFSAPRELWEQHRGRIEALYWVDQRPLPQLMGMMEKEHGFCATAKMYKLRFKEWGLEKNIKSDEAKAMLSIRKRRREELNTETEFVLRGRVVTDVRLERFQKRLKIDIEALATDTKWDLQKMGLEYRTPKTTSVSTSADEAEADEDETLDSSFQDDMPERVSSSGSPKQPQNNTPSSGTNPDAEPTEPTEPAKHPDSCSGHKPSTPEVSRKRLEIIQNVFKHVRAISIDRMCQDIIIPAMSTGDDELIRALLDDETTECLPRQPIKEQLLHLAVVHGRSSIISLILDKGGDMGSSPPGTAPALHQAVLHHQNTNMVDILLGANAAIDAPDTTGKTALGLAVSLEKFALVKHLVQCGANVDYCLRPSLPPLYEAMLVAANVEICQFLKSHGALTCTADSCQIEQAIREEWVPFSHTLLTHSVHGICKFTILLKACELGKVDDVASLFSDLSFLTSSQGRKILSLALANKYLDLAKPLIVGDVGNLNESLYESKTALELSVDIGDEDLVSLAMAKTKPSLYPIALLMAVHLQNFPVSKLLLEAGSSQTDTLLQYPLIVAAQKGGNNLVSLLLLHGADPNHQNQYGMRPLELAVDWGRDATAEILIQAGAVPSADLLSKAIRNRLARLARHLLTHCSADPNQICPDTGLSPLQGESSKRDPNYDLVTLLLRFGADMYQTSPWQTTTPSPLLNAIRERNTLLVKSLLDNHKCNRIQCRRELPAVLREADPLLLSDVQDSISGHDSQLWQPGELEDMEIDLDMDLDTHAHTRMEPSEMAAATTVTSGAHPEPHSHHPRPHPAHPHTHTLDLDSSAFNHQHQPHYDPGPQQQQHHHHHNHSHNNHHHHHHHHSHPHHPHHPHPGSSTGPVYGFEQDHHQGGQNVVAPVIDFRTMTTIYPYWNPILLGVIPPHNDP